MPKVLAIEVADGKHARLLGGGTKTAKKPHDRQKKDGLYWQWKHHFFYKNVSVSMPAYIDMGLRKQT